MCHLLLFDSREKGSGVVKGVGRCTYRWKGGKRSEWTIVFPFSKEDIVLRSLECKDRDHLPFVAGKANALFLLFPPSKPFTPGKSLPKASGFFTS